METNWDQFKIINVNTRCKMDDLLETAGLTEESSGLTIDTDYQPDE